MGVAVGSKHCELALEVWNAECPNSGFWGGTLEDDPGSWWWLECPNSELWEGALEERPTIVVVARMSDSESVGEGALTNIPGSFLVLRGTGRRMELGSEYPVSSALVPPSVA